MDIAWGGLGNYRMTGAVDWTAAASRRRMETSVRGSAVNSCYLALLIALSRTDVLTIGLEIDQVGVHGHACQFGGVVVQPESTSPLLVHTARGVFSRGSGIS